MPQPIKAYLGNVPLFDAGQSSAGYQRPTDWLPLPAAESQSVKILKAVLDQLKNNYKPITELRSAVIWTKGVSSFDPDFSVEYLPTNPWIHQPFEGYDSLRPAGLMEKWKV